MRFTKMVSTPAQVLKKIDDNPFVASNLLRVNDKESVIKKLESDIKETSDPEISSSLQSAKKELEAHLKKSPDFLFPLQTQTWIKMQLAVTTGLSLPITQSNFTDRYGKFNEKIGDFTIDNFPTVDINDTVQIFKDLNDLLIEFGDPRSIVGEINKYTSTDSPPTAIFAHSIWLAQQTRLAAESIKQKNNFLSTTLPKIPSAEDRYNCLNELVIGKGGIAEEAQDMAKKCNALNNIIANYYKRLFEKLQDKTPGAHSLVNYLGKQNTAYAIAGEIVKKEKEEIKRLQEVVEKLREQYIAFSVTGGFSPLFCFFPPFFFFNGLFTGGLFGGLAGTRRKQLDERSKNLKNLEKDLETKMLLVSDVEEFNRQSKVIDAKGKDFLDAVGNMTDGWTDLESNLNKLVKETSADALKDLGKWSGLNALEGAQSHWNRIISSADRFKRTGFITVQEDS
jgi:hypothetical protein